MFIDARDLISNKTGKENSETMFYDFPVTF